MQENEDFYVKIRYTTKKLHPRRSAAQSEIVCTVIGAWH